MDRRQKNRPHRHKWLSCSPKTKNLSISTKTERDWLSPFKKEPGKVQTKAKGKNLAP